MKHLYISLLLIIMVRFTYGQSLFPEVISCFGGYAKNENIHLTWTAGELLYETVSNKQNILTQGFNQNVYIASVTAVEEISLKAKIYPNPTSGTLSINIQSEPFDLFYLRVFDLQGRNVKFITMTGSFEKIDISHLPPGSYFLNVSCAKQLKSKTYQIIKTN
jgi:hypothetical protein